MSCTKQTTDLSFPVEPRIVLDSVSADTLYEFQDKLVLFLSYEDGDGDLGTSNPDVNSIFIKDSRLANPDEYYLPPLAPEEERISIQGRFQVELDPTFLLGNGDQETSIFNIYVRDRAGNKSNEVQTPAILITR